MAENNPTETVPKADFEALRTKADETNRTMESLKEQLLAPEYLEYLASRKAPAPAAKPAGTPGTSLANMSLEQLQEMIRTGAAESVKEVIKPLTTRISDIAVRQELDDVMKRYPDFDALKDKTIEILQSSPNELTIEQAYLIAKQRNPPPPPENKEKEEKKPAPKANEKPSSNVPVDGESLKKFKDPADAGAAAWSEVAARHGLSGDTI